MFHKFCPSQALPAQWAKLTYMQYIQLKFDNASQKKVQQCIIIKTTEMVGNRSTRKAKTMRVSQHRMPDLKL